MTDDRQGPRVDARAVILSRIREVFPAPPSVSVPRDYERSLGPGTDVVALFAERVADYQATVVTTAPAGLASTIAAAIARRGARRIVVPDGVPDGWLADAMTVELVGDAPPLSKSVIDGLDGVITGCAVAIAETGTIVLDAGPGQGRRVLSLLPDHHLCVVFADQVVGTVPEALVRLDPRRPLTWISGPSATSDIELQRVEGVHGPRMLDVIVVEAEPATA